MVDVSLHILDIVQNSIRAGARKIHIIIVEDIRNDILKITVVDDGKGMDETMVSKVTDPFFTSRKTRKVGLGIPLLKQNAEMCKGGLSIQSKPGKGTTLEVRFQYSHMDRPPMGDIAGTMKILIAGNPEIEVEFEHKINNEGFRFTTKEIKQTLDGIPISEPDVLNFIESMINDNMKALHEFTGNK